ncbi:MAG: glycosyl hydrolase family 95 catalytic domain-containing protein [Anaerorhabdus sp.]
MTKLISKIPAKIFQEGYPIGNGKIGAMSWGGFKNEIISLNEDTLWSGTKDKENPFEFSSERENDIKEARNLLKNDKNKQADKLIEKKLVGRWSQTYLPFARLLVNIKSSDKVSNCIRELDIENAIVKSKFELNNNVITKDIFASYIDNVIMLKIESSEKLSFDLVLQSQNENAKVNCKESDLIISGKAPIHQDPIYDFHKDSIVFNDEIPSVNYYGIINIFKTDGKISHNNDKITVSDSKVTIVMISLNTSYSSPFSDPKELLFAKDKCEGIIKLAKEKQYNEIYSDHLEDFKKLFDKVDFKIQDEKITQLFDLGRYLLISSSRKGAQPANLQGIWNDFKVPPWGSNYTLNINTPMNYWFAEVCSLSECHEPLFEFISELSISGKDAAASLGCKGWTANHNSDLWRQAHPSKGSANYAFWPMAGPWLCLHLWQHYEFQLDKKFLCNKAFPIMLDCARFCLDFLIEDELGNLVTSPSTSPENSFLHNFSTCQSTIGSTMDLTIIEQLFRNILDADKIIKSNHKLISKIEEAIDKLKPYRIGKDGQLLEFAKDYKEKYKSHRHLSHLFALYPGDGILYHNDPKIIKASDVSLEKRSRFSKGWTGWSIAWKVCLYARLKNGDEALEYIEYLLNKCSYNNLLGKHKLNPLPFSKKGLFQIDSNFGVTAGICEMLLQSHNGVIYLLPALPKKWKSGHIKGLSARGMITVDIIWNNNKLKEAKLVSNAGGTIKVKANEGLCIYNQDKKIDFKKFNDEYIFDSKKGESYILKYN